MTQELITECPICQQSRFTHHLTCTDYLVSKQEFAIQQCEHCSFRFTNPRPEASTLEAYYQSSKYVSHNDKSEGVINALYRYVRSHTLQQKLRLLNSLHPNKGSLLDVGCGTGLFLDTCKKGGWTIKGIEPDINARSLAESRINNSIDPTLDSVVDRQFDVITMWHVLEHVPNLSNTMGKLYDRLKPSGTLLLALPNSNSLDAKHYGRYWAAYDLPRHLSHFTPTTVKELVNRNGFNCMGERPMLFDSFYIAMLSTQHRDGKTNWAESLYQGFRSNIAAYKSGNYSSLIYLLKRG